MIPTELTTLGDHIRKARIERGQYQSDLAKLFKVKTDTVTNWELNRNKIGRIYLYVIEEYLGYLPAELALTELARKLLSFRWEHQLTLKKMAKQIGVDYTILAKAEIGQSNFQKPILKRLQSVS